MNLVPPRFTARRLSAADAADFRDLRLEALETHPESFGASWEAENGKPVAWFEERLEKHAVFGGYLPAGRLAACAGLQVPDAQKLRHKGTLWGMYARPEARGTGLGAALLEALIGHARDDLEEIQLRVASSNEAAIRLYLRTGFVQYGLEKRALKVDGIYYDDIMMALSL
ncbi:MAG: GNAT family N-acetyltransferase [Janthinobacterium lividum]